MSISYSGIVGYGKATLPSVEGGFGSMNILRDPPKSIMTRRIDKVGETSSITDLIDDSGNRACEAINLYARGVNPMVSVSYSNTGGNGTGSLIGNGNKQAFLPFRVARDGAFRPPIVTPYQLLPLSRQPRTNTSAFSKPGFADFTRKLMCPGGNYREIVDTPLKTCVRPTATYKMNPQSVEPFEVKYVIKNPVKFDSHAGTSGVRTQDVTVQEVMEPTKEIKTNPLHVDDVYSKQSTIRYVDNSNFDTDRYIQDTLHSSVQSKMSRSIQITPIEDIFDVDIHTKNNINISYTPLKTGYTKEEYIHNDPELQRRNVLTEATTNKRQDIYSRPEIQHQEREQKRNRPVAQATTNYGTVNRQSGMDLNSREYKLHPTISAGGFDGRGQMPMHERMNRINENFDSDKMKMSRKIMDMQHSRH